MISGIQRMSSAETKALFTIKFTTLSKIVSGLPLFGTVFCVVWSILYNFEASTATHCRVPNYLPSISSAIGGYTPQRYVWRICIALHAAPRFMIATAYYTYHSQRCVGRWYRRLVILATLLHILENFALVGLTNISSIENHGVHENLFITFMICSQVYMLVTCILFKWGHSSNHSIRTGKEKRSVQLKTILFVFNVSVFLVAVYLFFRHNSHCEPGVYTLFAAAEYMTVISNIAFHYTACIDFCGQSVSISPDVLLQKTTLHGEKHS